MKLSRQTLFRLSRDRRFLIRAAVTISVVSIALGLVISIVSTRAGARPFAGEVLDESVLEDLHRFADVSNLDTAQMAGWIRNPGWVHRLLSRNLARGFDEFDAELDLDEFANDLKAAVLPFVEEGISKSEKIDSSERKLLFDLFNGLHGDEQESKQAFESLRSAAAMEPARRFAAEFLADVLAHRDENDEALTHYRREVGNFAETSRHSRLQTARLLKEENREDELREVFGDPAFREVMPYSDRVRIATYLGDWGYVYGLTVVNDLRIGNPALFCLSLFAGYIWLVIVTQFSGYGRIRILFYFGALALGWLSASSTRFVVYLEDLRGFVHDPADPLVTQLIYCIAGIGLREEFIKLLFFIPLVPFLYRRGGEIEALVCAGLVGLGFAVNENANYVGESLAAFTAWSRFLTANFLHVAMTGVIGLAFFRMCRWPKRLWDNFLYDFLIIVAIHGAYDALIMIPALGDYQILTLVIYALTAYLFLDHAAQLMRTGSGQTVSPLAVFVIGSASLIGVILAYASWGMPFREALSTYIRNIAEMLPLAFVFINRLRNH